MVLMTGMGAGLTWGSALIEWTANGKGGQIDEQGRVLLPGSGLAGSGHGQEIAEAEPEAMAVFTEGSEAAGLDLRAALLRGRRVEDLVHTEVQQPALVATSLAVLAALRKRGLEPDYVVGHSVGEFTALAATMSLTPFESIALVRERGLAMAEAAQDQQPGSMAAILGLEDEVVEQICNADRGRVAGELQLPGPDRRLRRAARP